MGDDLAVANCCRRTSVALYAHPRIRQKASELRPHEDISGYVIDHDLSPCQVVLSVRADSPLSLQHKQAKRGFPEEIPSGPVWVDKFGLSSTRTRSLLGHADADKATLIRARIIHDGAVSFRALSPYSMRAVSEKTSRSPEWMKTVFASVISFVLEAVVCRCRNQDNSINCHSCVLLKRHLRWLPDTPNARGGIYRVLEPGWITAGDRAVLIKRLNPSWSVTRFNNIIGGKDPTRKEFAELTDYADSRQSGSGPPKSVTQHERVRVVS